MVSMSQLWLPILLSAFFVFMLSAIINMLLPYHRSDYVKVPNEDAVMDALRPFAIPPGDYALPRPESGKDMRSPAFIEKMNRGPKIIMTVMPNGAPSMGPQLAQWFVYCAVISVFAAYVASRTVTTGTYLDVFRFAGVTAFAAYSLALWQDSIWYKRKRSTTIKSTFDGLIYALVTAGTFGWLWP